FQRLFHFSLEAIFDLSEGCVGTTVLCELIVQSRERLLFYCLDCQAKGDGFARDSLVWVTGGVWLRDRNDVALVFPHDVSVDLQPQNGDIRADFVELTVLFRPFERPAV